MGTIVGAHEKTISIEGQRNEETIERCGIEYKRDSCCIEG